MADYKKLITMTRVNESGGYDTLYPKTLASQVFVNDTGSETLADHVTNTDVHLTADERAALTATNSANGYLKLGEDGYVPVSKLNPSVIAVHKEFNNVAGLVAGADGVQPGQLVMVVDATDDSTVGTGWAIYRKRNAQGVDFTIVNDVPETFVAATGTFVSGTTYFTDATGTTEVNTEGFEAGVTDVSSYFVASGTGKVSGWQKIAESESLDVVVNWDSIQNKPSSTVADIDDAVTKKHEHSNKAVLDSLTYDTTLKYNGNAIAFTNSVIEFQVVDSSNVPTASSLKANDLVFVVSGTVA